MEEFINNTVTDIIANADVTGQMEQIEGTHEPVALVSEDYNIHSLEKFQKHRSSYKVIFETHNYNDWVSYNQDNDQDHAKCFVDSNSFFANTTFDIGSKEEPGHCRHIASLKLAMTAAFKAFNDNKDKYFDQKDAANFLEEWGDYIEVYTADGNVLPLKKATNGFLNITVDQKRSSSNSVSDFGHNQSSMEKVEAKNQDQIPAAIEFKCSPFLGFEERSFYVRTSIITSGHSTPTIAFRPMKLEQTIEDVTEEFKGKIKKSLSDTNIKTYVGTAR